MNRNKIIKIICAVILFIIIIAIGIFSYNKINTKNELKEIIVKEKVSPLLYEVTKDGSSNKIYLFGSIHVANTSKTEFPKYIIDAYNNSSYLACEFNVVEYEKNSEKVLTDAIKMMYQDGTTIKDHLNSKTYEKLVNFLTKKKKYTEIYDNYKPLFFESLLSLQIAEDAQINSNEGIDTYFLNKAIEDNKNILEVESSDFQMNLSMSFPDRIYEIMFDETIDEYDNEVKALNDLYKSWTTGNKDEILKLIDDEIDEKKDYSKEDIKIIRDYNKKMVDERNENMTDKAIEYFNSNKNVFYMVGTAHIIGKTGLVNSLQDKGYTVKQVN